MPGDAHHDDQFSLNEQQYSVFLFLFRLLSTHLGRRPVHAQPIATSEARDAHTDVSWIYGLGRRNHTHVTAIPLAEPYFHLL